MRRFVLTSLLSVQFLAAPALAQESQGILERLEDTRLRMEAAVSVHDLRIALEFGDLQIVDAVAFPVAGPGERPSEWVLIGDAKLRIDPPDALEAAQLELFTGARSIRETFTEAVLVSCDPALVATLLAQPHARSLEDGQASRAVAIHRQWTESVQRKVLDVERSVIGKAAGEEQDTPYFACWMKGQTLDHFAVVINPNRREQFGIGQFVPLDLNAKEARKTRKHLHRSQRKGRSLGVDLEDLGDWNTWISTSLHDESGALKPGHPGFEPRHYELDLGLAKGSDRLLGKTRITVEAVTGGKRALLLNIDRDLLLSAVRGPDGLDLPFKQVGPRVHVLLAEAPAKGQSFELTAEWSGVGLTRVASGLFRLANTEYWYPHLGQVDRATYGVKLTWPPNLDLVASGRVIERGRLVDGRHWQRRTLDVPVMFFSFEVGHYDVSEHQVGHVTVTVALDKAARQSTDLTKDEITSAVTDSLAFFESNLGPYPLDHLTCVTAARGFSQSSLGFMSLSTLHAIDDPRDVLGLTDRRIIVAHEMAHNWWGNMVGWQSYRDEWLSEGMASYLSLVWMNNRLNKSQQPEEGALGAWERALSATAENGRAIETLGPIVLGRRLNSSLSDEAHDAILYGKGAVVLNMLSEAIGEARFLSTLKKIHSEKSGSSISTSTFLNAVTETTGVDLGVFTEQHVYGTGLTDIYYSIQVQATEKGAWLLSGMARQEETRGSTVRVVSLPGGRLDCLVEPAPVVEPAASVLVVPFQVSFHDPGIAVFGKKAKRAGKSRANTIMEAGRLLIPGQHLEFEMKLDYKPIGFWLDRESVVAGRFFSLNSWPKRVAFLEAREAWARGQPGDAAGLLVKALRAQVTAKAPKEMDQRTLLKREGQSLDARIQLMRARLLIDRGLIDDAELSIKVSRTLHEEVQREVDAELVEILTARIALRRGQARRALALLEDRARGRDQFRRTEGWVTLAIAAHLSGKADLLRHAREEAERRGADLSGLVSG